MSAFLLRAVAVLILVLPGCGPSEPVPTSPLVVVTIFPLADLTARVAGPEIVVETLLPPRASPATWEAVPAQIRSLHRARGVVSVGAGLDPWVEELLPSERPAHLRVVDGMELRAAGHDHGPGGDPDVEGDPHVWLDPILVRDRVLPRLEAFLRDLVPEAAAELDRRAREVSDSLTALDASIRETLAGADGRSFVATHDAWSYFAAAYGLESLGSVYERPGHEPSARGLATLVEAGRSAGVTTVLAEPQLAGTGARALAEELGGTVRVVDPLGGAGLDGRESYFDMMRFNARAFREALAGA